MISGNKVRPRVRPLIRSACANPVYLSVVYAIACIQADIMPAKTCEISAIMVNMSYDILETNKSVRRTPSFKSCPKCGNERRAGRADDAASIAALQPSDEI